jgi:hypothetical protein
MLGTPWMAGTSPAKTTIGGDFGHFLLQKTFPGQLGAFAGKTTRSDDKGWCDV